jgi:hypothetical protein
MSDQKMKLRTMQILCFGFIMGLSMIIIIFAVVLWTPEVKSEGHVYLIAAMAVMMSSYMAGVLVNKVMLAALIQGSITAGQLDLDQYQRLMIIRIALLEGPELVAVVLFTFMVGGSPLVGLNPLFALPVIIFYIGIAKVFPTQVRLDRIHQLIAPGS